MFADSRSYPAKTVAGMFKQEQELAKADEAGLILTAADLQPELCDSCEKQPIYIGNLCRDCWDSW